MHRSSRLVLVAIAVVVGSVAAVLAQRDFSTVEIKSEKLGDHVWMLTGAGGNIGVCAGDDGVFLIDDQYAPLTDKIRAAVTAISPLPIRFIVNTHWHGDHTGGNENFAKAGVLLVAQENVRKRMGEQHYNPLFDNKTEPSPAAAWPVITFTDSLDLHLAGEDVCVAHVEAAHTDGDAVLWFKQSNIVHMGDTFFNGMYPFIDTSSGGSVDGMIAATAAVLAHCDANTKVIPGHGPIGDTQSLQAFHDMLVGTRDAVRKASKKAKTLADVQAAKPTAAWDDKWGKGFMKPDTFVQMVYADINLKRPKKK